MRNRIKELRERSGITQKALADLLGFDSHSIVSMWESGDRLPRADKLPELARLLGCTVDELLADDRKEAI